MLRRVENLICGGERRADEVIIIGLFAVAVMAEEDAGIDEGASECESMK